MFGSCANYYQWEQQGYFSNNIQITNFSHNSLTHTLKSVTVLHGNVLFWSLEGFYMILA